MNNNNQIRRGENPHPIIIDEHERRAFAARFLFDKIFIFFT